MIEKPGAFEKLRLLTRCPGPQLDFARGAKEAVESCALAAKEMSNLECGAARYVLRDYAALLMEAISE